jgi:predicted transcriptional regulator
MNEYNLKSQIKAYEPHLKRHVNSVLKLKKIQDKAVEIWGGRPGINDPILMASIVEAILIFRSCNTEVNISSLACHLNIGRTRLYRVLKVYEASGLCVLKKNKNQTYVYTTSQTIKDSLTYYEYLTSIISAE